MRQILFFSLYFFVLSMRAQVTADFDALPLAPNSYYKDTNDLSFESVNAVFRHEWVTGQFPYWSGGFSYTNKYDSSTAGYTNLYGVRAYKGRSNSSIYLVGQHKSVVKLKSPGDFVHGFYFTNTTYAYLAMRDGDGFARKFGDTTGTKSGTTISQGAYPDWFKMVVKGYRNGQLKNDSVEIFLADYRDADNSKDYIVKDWRYAETWKLGLVDSIQFFLRSSDVGVYGMNTPAFFALDDFTTASNPVGMSERTLSHSGFFPNPFKDELQIDCPGEGRLRVFNSLAKTVMEKEIGAGPQTLDVSDLLPGVYYFEFEDGNSVRCVKLIRQ